MVPKGGIISWSGSIANIPTGYQLCDGTNGTPDLRNKFVPGAGDTYAVDEAGGTVFHVHGFVTPLHSHAPGNVINAVDNGPASAWDGGSDSSSESPIGETGQKDNLPPFLALAYIQRMV